MIRMIYHHHAVLFRIWESVLYAYGRASGVNPYIDICNGDGKLGRIYIDAAGGDRMIFAEGVRRGAIA